MEGCGDRQGWGLSEKYSEVVGRHSKVSVKTPDMVLKQGARRAHTAMLGDLLPDRSGENQDEHEQLVLHHDNIDKALVIKFVDGKRSYALYNATPEA
eukprot:4861473-Amphidinium_carterae.1